MEKKYRKDKPSMVYQSVDSLSKLIDKGTPVHTVNIYGGNMLKTSSSRKKIPKPITTPSSRLATAQDKEVPVKKSRIIKLQNSP
jgi:hypothetical protein